jgi:hypothetical protein
VGSLDGNASVIDLGLYNMQGGLVKSLAKGASLPGNYALPLDGAAQGAYVVKLMSPEGVAATPALLGR